MTEIKVGSSHIALVDDDMVELVSRYRWSYSPSASKSGGGYAITRVGTATIYMHRLIMAATGRTEVDHRDSDGLNNLTSNLRICTRQQNGAIQRKQRGKSSAFKGVTFDKQTGAWKAQLTVTVNRKETNLHLGRFASERDAAAAYNRAAVVHFGQFARLNILPEP